MRAAFLLGFALLWIPLALFAQDTTVVIPEDGGTSSALLGVLAAVGTIVAGYVAKLAYDGLKTIIPAYDNLPAIVHQVAAPLFGFLFGAITSGTGAALLTDIHEIDIAWIGGILVTLIQAGFKRLEKSKEPRDTTEVLLRNRGTKPMDRTP
jgi:hypothetical protein